MRGYFLMSAVALLCGCTAPSQNLQSGVPANLAQEAFVTLDPAGKNVSATMFQSGEELLKEVNNLVLICKPVMDSYAGSTRKADFESCIEKINTFKK